MDKLQMRLYDLYSYIVDGDKHSIKDIHDWYIIQTTNTLYVIYGDDKECKAYYIETLAGKRFVIKNVNKYLKELRRKDG